MNVNILKHRRNGMSMVATILLLLQGTVLSTNVADDTAALTSSSTTQTSGATDLLAAAWDTMSLTIEELWLRETKQAENEIERQMQGLMGSMSMLPIPQSAPVTTPNAIPTTSPVDVRSPTTSPTTESCLNGRTTEQYLLDTLSSVTTSVDVLLNPMSPQGRAFSFLLNDTLIETEDSICNYTTLQQRYGLGT